MLHIGAKSLLPAFLLVLLQQTIRVDVSLVTVGVQVSEARDRVLLRLARRGGRSITIKEILFGG